ncbi:hypothetical protein DENSPDRAFT_749550, partial [Dentipellis sp. KUC8613]
MDTSVSTPPSRILVTSTKKLSTRAAHAALDDFLDDFQQRSSPLKGGDHTVTVQLQKLNQALQEERERKKAK